MNLVEKRAARPMLFHCRIPTGFCLRSQTRFCLRIPTRFCLRSQTRFCLRIPTQFCLRISTRFRPGQCCRGCTCQRTSITRLLAAAYSNPEETEEVRDPYLVPCFEADEGVFSCRVDQVDVLRRVER